MHANQIIIDEQRTHCGLDLGGWMVRFRMLHLSRWACTMQTTIERYSGGGRR